MYEWTQTASTPKIGNEFLCLSSADIRISFNIGFAKKFSNICTAKTAWQRDFILSFVSLITQIGLVQDVPIKI